VDDYLSRHTMSRQEFDAQLRQILQCLEQCLELELAPRLRG